ncbi:MAG: diguanylate cyclase (GGDEF)-like protein/PAS domain S-box-containing protein [Oceanicoccus sp.]|jgi:diguanylate cyclase (GGDEF)-like protein/PAS domain S-box-containing protein
MKTPTLHRHLCCTLLCILSLLPLLLAQKANALDTISLNNDPNEYILMLPFSEVMQDESGKLTIDQVTQPRYEDDFHSMQQGSYRFFGRPGSYWFRFTLQNDTDSDIPLLLECDDIRLDNIQLYQAVEQSLQFSLIDTSGDTVVKPEWNMQERLNILRMTIPAGATQHYYLRVENAAGVRFTARIYNDHSHIIYFGNVNVQLGIITGILFALFLYTLTIYIALKDRTFLYFLLLISAVFMQTSASLGIIKIAMPGSNQLVDFMVIAGAIINALASVFFIRRFLLLEKYNPVLSKLILASGFISLFCLPIYLWSQDTGELAAIMTVSITSILTVISSFIRLKNGFKPAIFILAGSLVVLLPMLIIVILPESSLPAMSTTNLLNICVAIKLIIWASAMSSRIDNINKQLSKEISERKLREKQLLQAQMLARYGDWSWDTLSNRFVFSASAKNIFSFNFDDSKNIFDQLLDQAQPDEKAALEQAFGNGQQSEQSFHAEFSMQQQDGSTQYYMTQADYQRDDNGNSSSLLIGTLHDITEKKLADFAYTENEQRWRDLADSTFEAILIYQNSIIIDANHPCENLLGYSPSQLIGSSGESFIDPKKLPDLLKKISAAQSNVFEFSLRRKDHPDIEVELRSRSGNFNQKPVHIVAIRDISERKEYEQKLQKLGYYDSLTGLANRTLFLQRLQRAINKSERTEEKHALLFIDLDQFKNVNDSLGHDIGDRLLLKVAQRLEKNSRKTDTVARLGGDEFAILVEDIGAPYTAAKIADELIRMMAVLIEVDDYKLLVTPSIGIALYPTDGETTDELLRKADTAMYHAKSQGRNNYQFYTKQLNEKIIRRMALESALRTAIKDDEFYLYYQPKVCLKTGNIVGAEALLRWESAKFGFVSPVEFIPVAEETGLIWPIGELVLKQASLQLKNWIDRFPNFESMAVNISGIQFNHNSLVDTVTEVLQEYQIPPAHLELEITESAIIDNAEDAIKVMIQLKELGVKLSLDDFGTGYSSLSYLKRFPVDSLKIDRSFVAEIVSNPIDMKIADNIVKLAHTLGLNVVAEGVETDEQLEMINAMDCDQLQGYIFSKPIDQQELTTMLANQDNLYNR